MEFRIVLRRQASCQLAPSARQGARHGLNVKHSGLHGASDRSPRGPATETSSTRVLNARSAVRIASSACHQAPSLLMAMASMSCRFHPLASRSGCLFVISNDAVTGGANCSTLRSAFRAYSSSSGAASPVVNVCAKSSCSHVVMEPSMSSAATPGKLSSTSCACLASARNASSAC
jgi:hypothetical protein